MSFDPASRSLKIEVKRFNESTVDTEKTVKFSLVDPNGLSTNYTMSVKVQAAITTTQAEDGANSASGSGGSSGGQKNRPGGDSGNF